jgi:hypothetical protein
MRQTQNSVVRKADAFTTEVSDWHPSTLKAFVLKEGNHCTKAVGKVAWNDKLMQPAVKCINPGWDQLILREKKALAITQKAAYNALSVIQDGMKGLYLCATKCCHPMLNDHRDHGASPHTYWTLRRLLGCQEAQYRTRLRKVQRGSG